MSEYLEVRELTKIYGKRKVVDNVSLRVEPGKVVGLLGKNGAGKSTTFRMIAGLVKPDSGHVFLNDENISSLPMYRRAQKGIGYLPQEPSVFTKLTVAENILIILENIRENGKKLRHSERIARLNRLLKEMQLEYLRNHKAEKLSGGERRRLEVTRALATSPSFMMWDEPFAAVDPKVVEYLQKIIIDLKERGIGILLTDHKPIETLSVTDYTYVINDGKILKAGSSDELIHDQEVRDAYLGENIGKVAGDRFAGSSPTESKDYMAKGKKLLETGGKACYQEAARAFTHAITLGDDEPGLEECYLLRGTCFFYLEAYNSAKLDFSEYHRKCSENKKTEAQRWLDRVEQRITEMYAQS